MDLACSVGPKLARLDPYLLDVSRSSSGEKIQDMDPKKKVSIRRNAHKLILWNETLFRMEKDRLRRLLSLGHRADILETFTMTQDIDMSNRQVSIPEVSSSGQE